MAGPVSGCSSGGNAAITERCSDVIGFGGRRTMSWPATVGARALGGEAGGLSFTGGGSGSGGTTASDGSTDRANLALVHPAVRHQLRTDLRQRFAFTRGLRPRQHDGHHAMDLQPDTVPARTLDEASGHAGRPDLSAGPLLLRHRGDHGCGHRNGEKDNRAKE